MAGHAFHQCYYHIVWTTKDRTPILVGDSHSWLLQQLNDEAQRRGGVVLACNVMPDHVHLLVSLKPAGCRATYIGQIKGALAFAYNKAKIGPERLIWQEGYGIITVPKSHTDRIVAYIENQQDIHARRKANRLLECIEQETE